MAPKRKSDAIDLTDDVAGTSTAAADVEPIAAATTSKKPRLSDKENTVKKGKATAAVKEKLTWQEVTLDGEDDGDLPV